MPNQDAIAWLPREAAAGHLVAAVSDGYGAAAHPRSDIGSQLAVEAASAVLDWYLTEGGNAHALAAQVLHAWRAAVGRHAAAAPADDWVEPVDDKLLPYGATLLGLAATDRLAVALQIGDGDLLLGYPDGRLERPLPDDAGLVREQTYSLYSPDALQRFRVAVMPARPDAGLPDPALQDLALRDAALPDFQTLRCCQSMGCRSPSRTRPPSAPWPGTTARRCSTAGPAAVLQGLPAWLDEVSQRGSDDDVTLCLAVRRGAW